MRQKYKEIICLLFREVFKLENTFLADIEIALYSLNGQKVFTCYEPIQFTDDIEIDASHLPNGRYTSIIYEKIRYILLQSIFSNNREYRIVLFDFYTSFSLFFPHSSIPYSFPLI